MRMLYFMKDGIYVLKDTVTTEGGTVSCERTVEVLPIRDIAFSLPEFGYTDTTEEVALLQKRAGRAMWPER